MKIFSKLLTGRDMFKVYNKNINVLNEFKVDNKDKSMYLLFT